jgi:transaldolase
MQFFIDTAEIEEIKKAHSWGFIDGVTTNPSLIAKSGKKQEDVIKQICDIVDGPISAEVIATDYEGMIKEGEALSKIHKNVVVKIPMTEEGMKACKWFSNHNIKTNVTLVFSPNQALLAAKNGATYVSPFIGRLDDIGHNGMELINEIKTIFDNYGYGTQVLAASIRHSQHVRDAALVGSDVATIPYGVLKGLFAHPLTTKGLEQFLADHAKSQK